MYFLFYNQQISKVAELSVAGYLKIFVVTSYKDDRIHYDRGAKIRATYLGLTQAFV